MAVWCGVCAQRITSAPENYGSFKTNGEDFGGWEEPKVGIQDTCESCAEVLGAAVAKAAEKITSRKNVQKRIQELKTEVTRSRAHYARVKEEEKKFEMEWNERRRKLGI